MVDDTRADLLFDLVRCHRGFCLPLVRPIDGLDVGCVFDLTECTVSFPAPAVACNLGADKSKPGFTADLAGTPAACNLGVAEGKFASTVVFPSPAVACSLGVDRGRLGEAREGVLPPCVVLGEAND